MFEKRRGHGLVVRMLSVSLAASALFAFTATAAQATGGYWYTGTTKENLTKLTGSKTVLASLGQTTFENGREKGKTATSFLISPARQEGFYEQNQIYATGAEFKEAVAKNEASAEGIISGRLILTGAKLRAFGCIIEPNEKLTSNPLYEFPRTINGKRYVELVAQAGPEKSMFPVPVGGELCGYTNNSIIKGTMFAEVSSISEPATSHALTFSKKIQTETKGSLSYLGAEAFAEGTIVEKLSEPLYWALK